MVAIDVGVKGLNMAQASIYMKEATLKNGKKMLMTIINPSVISNHFITIVLQITMGFKALQVRLTASHLQGCYSERLGDIARPHG